MEFFEELFASVFGKLKTIAYEIEFEELNTMKLDKKKKTKFVTALILINSKIQIRMATFYSKELSNLMTNH